MKLEVKKIFLILIFVIYQNGNLLAVEKKDPNCLVEEVANAKNSITNWISDELSRTVEFQKNQYNIGNR